MAAVVGIHDAIAHVSPWLARLFASGDLLRIAGVYAGLLLGRGLIAETIDSHVRRGYEWRHEVPDAIWQLTRPYSWLRLPERVTAVLPHVDHARHTRQPLTGHSRRAYAEFTVVVWVGVLAEELLFRGLPLLLAPTPTIAIAATAVGTVVWALANGRQQGLLICLTTGWVGWCCWLTGLGWLALLLHGLQNMLGLAVGLHTRPDRLAPVEE